jgi:hypothetical protein
MENYGTYGFHIGSGEHFDLSAYYKMCDEIAASFREHSALPDVSDISLTNAEVTSRLYGTGMVIEHDLNTIRVQFPGVVKSFILNAEYNQRTSFENDAEVVAAYTEYTNLMDRIHTLERQLHLLAAK